MALKFLPVLVMTSCWVITDAYAPTNSFVTLRPTKRSAVVGMRAQMGRFVKTRHTAFPNTFTHTGIHISVCLFGIE